MRSLRFLGPLLAALLLTTSTAGLVNHDHGLAPERGEYGCARDHQAEHDTATFSPTAGLRSSGGWHHHHCLQCQLNGHRSLLDPARGTDLGLGLGQEASVHPAAAPTLRLLPSSRSLRGPPLV